MKRRLFAGFAGLLIFMPLQVVLAQPLYNDTGNVFTSLAPMLKKVNPAVVNISTYSTEHHTYNPLLNDPFFRHFFDVPGDQRFRQDAQKKRQQSAGSGVIVDADKGIVMTNYHVIKGADDVEVSLIDGRGYQAKVMGVDPELDIAILSIKADGIAAVPMADSSELEVGDFVVAIGNPFGLGQTVTTGIVSALGRSGLGMQGYENFIQTDASINPGNSGGALVNFRGELVGINTAIIAPAGGNVGIGFAIPINMAKASMAQILKSGEVKRGQIGVSIQDITPDLRQAFNLQNGQTGVLITDVVSASPAQKAGLKPGDIVVEIDGKPTRSTGQLRSQLGMKAINDRVKLVILREGARKSMSVKVGEPTVNTTVDGKLHPLLNGVQFSNNPDGQGVVVSALSSNSTAAYSGLRPGDVVVGANRMRVYDIDSFANALQRSQSSVLLHVSRNGGSLYIVIR